MKKNNTGFTLLELLISITIMGLFLALVAIKISDIKMKNRDAKRMMNVQEISNALNLYQNITNKYPVGNIGDMTAVLENAETIPKVPNDLLNSDSYIYTYNSANGSTYTFSFCLETNSIQGYSQGCHNKSP